VKITNAMVERAADSLHRDFALETVDAARAALEAALADVPEPNSDPPPAPGESWAGTAGRLGAELMLAQERIAELEAKLAKVRVWRDEYYEHIAEDPLGELNGILDSEQT
jgi:hypothetical protein